MKSAGHTSLLCLLLAMTMGCSAPDVANRGEVAPGFKLESLDGTWVSSDSFEGNALVLNFWATYCAPCLREIPELKKLAVESTAQIVGIALDKSGAKAVGPFVERHGIEYTILLGNDEVFQSFDGFGIPHTVVLDASFRVVKMYRGPVTREALEEDLQSIARGI
ncbi:MAG: hypothetical protein CME13_10230 [Gemmatimonadetes bacterium]|nr:hypothetical protein [Gemmatimonadota bacterium]HCV26208.1 hypothetical protein [Candidatus Latescibacterota bacterium]